MGQVNSRVEAIASALDRSVTLFVWPLIDIIFFDSLLFSYQCPFGAIRWSQKHATILTVGVGIKSVTRPGGPGRLRLPPADRDRTVLSNRLRGSPPSDAAPFASYIEWIGSPVSIGDPLWISLVCCNWVTEGLLAGLQIPAAEGWPWGTRPCHPRCPLSCRQVEDKRTCYAWFEFFGCWLECMVRPCNAKGPASSGCARPYGLLCVSALAAVLNPAATTLIFKTPFRNLSSPWRGKIGDVALACPRVTRVLFRGLAQGGRRVPRRPHHYVCRSVD